MDVKERFDLGESVGRDELGEVLRATERASGKSAAVKQFDEWALASEKGRDAYADALKALRRIRPARIPPVAAYSMTADSGWIASRWVDAPTLDSMLSSSGTLTPDVTASLGCGMLDALQELHSTGHAHGALSTRKVLVAGAPEAGSVVITDPFQHYLFSVTDPIKTSRTDPARYLGLPQYFSPEQAQGKPPTPASDMYVVGLILYEMLTGKSPFASNTVGTTLKRQIFEKPLKLRLAKPGLQTPDGLEEAIFRALEKDPAKRFESVTEFREALNAVRTDNAEVSIERLATPLGIAPVGVLAGEATPTDDPDDAGEAPAEASTTEETPKDVSEPAAPSKDASEPAETDAASGDQSTPSESDAQPEAESSESAPAADAATAAPDDEEPATAAEATAGEAVAEAGAEAAADTTASAASESSSSDTDSENDADNDSDDNASSSGRRNRKGKKGKKNRKGGGRNQDSTSVAAVATDDHPVDNETTKSTPEKTEAAAEPSTNATGSRQQIKLVAATSAPLDVESDDELGWFAEGQNEESLAEQFHVPQVRSDEANRNSKFFVAGLAVLIVLVIGGMAILSSTVPDEEEEDAASEHEDTGSSSTPSGNPSPTPPAAVPEAAVPAAQEPAADVAIAPDIQEPAEASAPSEVAPDTAVAELDAATAEEVVPDEAPAPEAVPAPVPQEQAAPEPEPEPEPVVAAAPTPAPTRTEPAAAPPARTEPTPPAPARQEPAVDNAAAEEAAAEARREQAADLARQGDSARNSGNDARATDLYNQALELNRSQANAHFGLGEIAFANQQFSQAVTHFRSATRASRRAEYFTRLGMAYYRIGNVEASIESLETAVERGDSSAQTMLDRLRERE